MYNKNIIRFNIVEYKSIHPDVYENTYEKYSLAARNERYYGLRSVYWPPISVKKRYPPYYINCCDRSQRYYSRNGQLTAVKPIGKNS